MAAATFEEKEYEIAAAVELAHSPDGGSGPVFASGQVLEAIVGYDAAADPPADHVLWRILRTPRPPGIVLVPSDWSAPQPSAERLPAAPVTLVLQFKRSEYMYGAAARQWHVWREPYFRFERQARQQRILAAFEQGAASRAVVRYAAPAFWRREQLEAAHLRRQVLTQSGFVSPRELIGHRWWTYVAPGGDGKANQLNRRSAHFEDLAELRERLAQRPASRTELVKSEALAQHVIALGAAAREAAPGGVRRDVATWTRALRREVPQLSSRMLGGVVALAFMSTVMARANAIWFVV